MYDIDPSPFNDLLQLQTECYRILGATSSEALRVDGIVEYWGDQDDDPPPIEGDSIAERVRSATEGMKTHIAEI